MTSGDFDHDEIEHRRRDPAPELGVGPELDYEAAFAALVAQFNEPAAAMPDRPVIAERPPEPVVEPAPEPLYPAELDEHFEPPEPPPLPRGDVYSRLAWAGVMGGPAFLLVAAFLGGDLPSVFIVAALGAFIAGFVTLVIRMPGERSDDDDNGAVV